jgi:hypothetical protein
MRRKLFLATALVAVAATAGAGIVFAAGAAWPGGGRGGPSVKAVGGGSGSGCGTAFETREDPFLPDSFSEAPTPDDLTPASSVSMLKKCAGGAVATFSSETVAEQPEPPSLPAGPGTQDVDNDDIQVMVRATCTHHIVNMPSSCHVGQTVWAAPGGFGDPVYFDLAPDIYETQSMQWAFSHLAAGGWRFDVLPVTNADDPNSALEFRTLFVETL